jgi:hypothetical protein
MGIEREKSTKWKKNKLKKTKTKLNSKWEKNETSGDRVLRVAGTFVWCWIYKGLRSILPH